MDVGDEVALRERRRSRWAFVFNFYFRTTPHGLLRALRDRGIGPVEELRVVGKRSGIERRLLVTAIESDGGWYVGHPSGSCAWTRNLDAAGRATLVTRRHGPIAVVVSPLENGDERDRAVEAYITRQPLPIRSLYRAANRFILETGRYYRLEPEATLEG